LNGTVESSCFTRPFISSKSAAWNFSVWAIAAAA
jgi:hypothetical protein